MARYISNAFSLNMLPAGSMWLKTTSLSANEAARLASDATSVVGHADTAAIFSAELGRDVEVNRASLRLAPGDDMVVGQYAGTRLPEGATELPEGATIRWVLVEVFGASEIITYDDAKNGRFY
jgi:hypothetical protein